MSSKSAKKRVTELLSIAGLNVNGNAPWDIQVHNENFYERVLAGGSLALGESYMDKWWVPGCTIGYEHTFTNALADFLKSLETGEKVQPDFRCALHTQRVCDGVLASAKRGTWVAIPDP